MVKNIYNILLNLLFILNLFSLDESEKRNVIIWKQSSQFNIYGIFYPDNPTYYINFMIENKLY